MLCTTCMYYHNLLAIIYTRFSFWVTLEEEKGNEALITNNTVRKWTDYDWIVDCDSLYWHFNLFQSFFSMKFYIFLTNSHVSFQNFDILQEFRKNFLYFFPINFFSREIKEWKEVKITSFLQISSFYSYFYLFF